MRISEDIINNIRDKASIAEVIGHYIPIIKKGRGYTAVCPFHDDHDPSLSIAEDKKIYKCFVCGDGGNVFTFVMHYKKCSFIEAVREVADIIGEPLPIDLKDTPKRISPFQPYYDLLNEAITFGRYVLNTKAGSLARNYLQSRGLDDDLCDYFDIGYNPPGDVMYKYLISKKFKDEDLIKVNIAREDNYGQMRDVFFDRIIFAIHDQNGNPIGFTARTMSKDSQAKYINTTTTPIYSKGDVVYNYHRAKEAAKKSGRVIICEGVMDVVAFKRADIEYSVCTLGTAMTSRQLRIIAGLSKHIVFCYDGDKAGQAATIKAVELCLKEGIEPYVIDNRSLLDPDEILNQGSKSDLVSFSNHELTGIEFAFEYYKKIYPLNNYANKKAYNMRLSEMISKMADKYDRDNMYVALKDITGLSRFVAKETVGEVKKNDRMPQSNSLTLNGLEKAEYTILSQMLLSKQAADIYRHDIGCLLNPQNDLIASLILDDYRHYQSSSIARIIDSSDDEDIKRRLLDLSMYELVPDEYNIDILMGAIGKVKMEIKKARFEELNNLIRNNEYTNKSKMTEYLQEYSRLAKELGGNKNVRKEK